MSTMLPSGWAQATIGEIASIRSGVGFPPRLQGRPSGDYPFAKVGDLSRASRAAETRLSGAENYINKEDLLEIKTSPLPARTIVFPKIGESIRSNYRLLCAREMLVDNNVMGIIPDTSIVEPQFLLRLLSTVDMYSFAIATAVPSIRKSDVEKISFILPPLNEQRRIVSKLESLLARSRRAKEALDAIPALLERFRQSVLAAAFRGDLTADWRAQHPDVEPASKLLERIRAERRLRWEEAELEKMRARGKVPQNDAWKLKYQEPEPIEISGLPTLPPNWCWTSLGTLLQQIEAGHSPKALGRPAAPHETGVLKVSAVSWGEFLPEENKALPPDQHLDSSVTIRAGDLLISRANTAELVGAVVLVQESHPNLMLSDKTLRLVPLPEGVSKEYLLYSLRSHWVRKVFEEDATGTSDSMRNLSQEKIRSAPIALAPIEEQHEIARQLGIATSKCTAILNQRSGATNKLAQLERSLLVKAFRGELVPQNPNDEPASVLLERIRAEREAHAGSAPKRSRGRSSAA